MSLTFANEEVEKRVSDCRTFADEMDERIYNETHVRFYTCKINATVKVEINRQEVTGDILDRTIVNNALKNLDTAYHFNRLDPKTQSIIVEPTHGPVRQSFEDNLNYLKTYRDSTCECKLYTDSAPYSFGFELFKGSDRWFLGGLIYHGPVKDSKGNLVRVENFTVDLSRNKYPHWGVHT